MTCLLIISFYTPEYLSNQQFASYKTSGSAIGVNTSEVLSNQLSHWLSQISSDVDIGVSYRPGDEMSDDEIEVAMSTQILNERVIINGNVATNERDDDASAMVGDVEVEVKLNKKGNLRVKAYNKANEDFIYEDAQYTQGVGLFYRKEFDTFGELLRSFIALFVKNKEKKKDFE